MTGTPKETTRGPDRGRSGSTKKLRDRGLEMDKQERRVTRGEGTVRRERTGDEDGQRRGTCEWREEMWRLEGRMETKGDGGGVAIPERSWTEKCRARERKRGERRLQKRMAGTWEQIMLPRDVTQHDGWTRSSSHHVRARASKNTRRESTADRLYQWHS
jgi:hypothetical protein